MRIFLRLKHWQLFILTWAPPMLMNIVSFVKPELTLKIFPIMMIFFTLGSLGWVWAISTGLQSKLPADADLNLRQFKMLFSVPTVSILGIIIWMGYLFYVQPDGSDGNTGASAGFIILLLILMLLSLFSMVCMILGFLFAAKTMKSVELGRMAKPEDYMVEFILIWFSPIGVWVLQPRLNKLTE